jgi:5-methylcytosine-specific restriction endonuclease McrA
MMYNPRQANGALRRKNRARLKARGDVCYLCGRPINYDSSDPSDPFGFVIDEIIPVSRWKEFGYASPRAVAEDFNNLAAAHRLCNARKSNKTIDELRNRPTKKTKSVYVPSDGEW